MIHKLRLTVAIACAVWLCAASASGQGVAGVLPGHLELSGGVQWVGSTSFGSSDAELTPPTGDRYRLFTTSSEWTRAAGVELRLGGRLTQLIEADLSVSYSRPTLRTSLGSDAENAAPTVASEALRHFAVAGAGVVHLPFLQVGRRTLPFVTAGAGVLRELHEGATLAETGQTYHVGGGVKIAFFRAARPRRALKQSGIRVEAVATIRSPGLALDGRRHAAPTISASVFGRF